MDTSLDELAARSTNKLAILATLIDRLATHHMRAQVQVGTPGPDARSPRRRLRWMNWRLSLEIKRLERQLLRIETARVRLGLPRTPSPNELPLLDHRTRDKLWKAAHRQEAA